MQAICHNCGIIQLTLAQEVGGKLACGAIGAAFGSQVKKNPLAMALCTLAGLAVGSYIDREVSKRCPRCGAILQIAGWLPS